MSIASRCRRSVPSTAGMAGPPGIQRTASCQRVQLHAERGPGVIDCSPVRWWPHHTCTQPVNCGSLRLLMPVTAAFVGMYHSPPAGSSTPPARLLRHSAAVTSPSRAADSLPRRWCAAVITGQAATEGGVAAVHRSGSARQDRIPYGVVPCVGERFSPRPYRVLRSLPSADVNIGGQRCRPLRTLTAITTRMRGTPRGATAVIRPAVMS